MNHRQANMLNSKDWMILLEKHPDNKWMKKWLNRARIAEEQRKKDGCPADFERAWSAYGKRGSKPDSLIEWNKHVIDADLVISCIPRYLKECKKEDTTIKHFQGWLAGERWERYEGITTKSKPVIRAVPAERASKPAELVQVDVIDQSRRNKLVADIKRLTNKMSIEADYTGAGSLPAP